VRGLILVKAMSVEPRVRQMLARAQMWTGFPHISRCGPRLDRGRTLSVHFRSPPDGRPRRAVL
jgi:hypothetical protein